MKQSVSRMVSNAVALVLLQAVCQSAAWADHPYYMHAISDLRTARTLLSQGDFGNVVKDCSAAVGEIDACIHDVESAAWYDGRNPHHNPPPDVPPDRSVE